MDARRILLFLLLVICTINAVFSIHNDRGGRSNVRRVRRISEYLVPPSPPPTFHPPGRIPRVANYQSASKPGFFRRLMNWIYPFGSPQRSPPPSPPPSPLTPRPEIPYSSKFIRSPLTSAAAYNSLSPVDYEKPPLPASSINDHPGYPAPSKTKNCNPCNKVPWLPMQQDTHSKDTPYVPSALESLPTNGHLPFEVPQDASYAASHDIRIQDFSFARLPDGQDGFFVAPLPTPHMYPGAVPPLFKPVDFNPPQVTSENSESLGATSSVLGNDAFTGNGFSLNMLRALGGHNEQFVYPSGPSDYLGIIPQEPGYINDASNREFEYFQNHTAHGDLFSNSTHVTLTPDQQGLEDINTHSFNSLNRLVGGSVNNASQIDQNLPSSYGSFNLDRGPNGKIEHLINVEVSPLLEFTDESRMSSPTANVFVDFQNAENTGTIVASDDDKIFKSHQGIASTEPHFSVDYFETGDPATKELEINSSATQDLHGHFWKEDIPSSKVKILDINTHPYKDTVRESYRNVLLKSYDDVTDETLHDNINVNLDVTSEQQSGKKNKQVQVIIPYTSDYTPFPFQPSYQRNISNTGNSNPDSYVGEESRNLIKVVRPPNSSTIVQFRPSALPISQDTSRKPVDIKANNSINVHKLQKNIDNWTIQVYEGTTVSTISSKNNLYLSPSKTIPKEFFTSTEPVGHIVDAYNDNVKTVTLTGFRFNDQEYKESANHRVEGSRIQEIKIEKTTKSPTDATSAEDTWRSFPVGISSGNKERVYIVTPQPQATPRSNLENRKQKALKEAESNAKESKRASQTHGMKEIKESDTFESIEKVYQVLPQAVNNLAVASTGPESVPLWGIMEHEDIASPADNEYDSNDNETEPPTHPLYPRLWKESRARR